MIYALVAVILIQAVLLGWFEYNSRKERKSMLNAILAKDNQELVNLELADRTQIKAPKEEEYPDFVESDGISDETYAEIIKNTLPNG